jgi:hypothetical protein
MQLFLKDLWADLREKRLWPVAVALVVGLIAVPLVLAKPATSPAPAAVPAPTSQLPDAGLKVLAASDDTGAGSDLGVFNPKDPFRPPSKVLHRPTSAATASSATSGSAGPSSGGASAAGSPSSSSAGGSAGSGGGSGTPGGNSGGGSGGGSFTPSRPTTRTQRYEYVVDVTFSHNTRTRRVKSMHRLDMLPSQNSPLLIFMGVDKNASNAVFLVDSTLTGVGEGTCRPSPDKCSFLYLGPGSVHAFTGQDGQSYTIRLDEIRRVKVPSAKKASSKSSKSKRASSKQSARAKGAQVEPRAFVPPVLIDLVDVATTTPPRHSSKPKRDR